MHPTERFDRIESTRRNFMELAAAGAGLLFLAPTACVNAQAPKVGENSGLPLAKPTDWDPIAFNRTRGNAGAIPESYRAQINGREGDKMHLGKHLPYVPELSSHSPGMLALMWGDPKRGYAAHPNSAPSETVPEGHWFNWIRIRKATQSDATEVESRFSAWPHVGPQDTGRYAARSGSDPTADAGKNTVYLTRLPADVRPGDLVRVHAHCVTHGEYVDFVVVPEPTKGTP